jgi:hypothetical protein
MKKKKNPFLDWLCSPKPLIVISFLIIVFSLIAPWAFTRPHFFENIIFNNDTGVIGDTFGIMNPIIAIAAAIITFAAFWTQYQANAEMLEENKEERDDAIILKRKQQLINQFYEMLKIHQDNVKELKYYNFVELPEKKSLLSKNVSNSVNNTENEKQMIVERGRSIFEPYLVEFNIAYYLTEILFSEKEKKEKARIAYDAFYKGSSEKSLNELVKEVEEKLNSCNTYDEFEHEIVNYLLSNKLCEYKKEIRGILKGIFDLKDFFHNHSFLKGHFGNLNHYYRHLFLMVKMIAKEDEEILSYPEKRDLLRILRAQLSNKEQIMLFYNWFSDHGKQWEEFGDKGNHFFTKFRMIHNMTPYDVIPFKNIEDDSDIAVINFIQYFSHQVTSTEDFEKHPVFNLKYAEKEYPEKKNDPLFEFEDWYETEDHKFRYGN